MMKKLTENDFSIIVLALHMLVDDAEDSRSTTEMIARVTEIEYKLTSLAKEVLNENRKNVIEAVSLFDRESVRARADDDS